MPAVVSLLADIDETTVQQLSRGGHLNVTAIPSLLRVIQHAPDAVTLQTALALGESFDDGQVTAAIQARAKQLGVTIPVASRVPRPALHLPSDNSMGEPRRRQIYTCSNGHPVEEYAHGCPP